MQIELLFKKKTNKGVEDILFFLKKTRSGIFRFFTCPIEIPDKTRLQPLKLQKIVLHQLQILRPKAKTKPLESPHCCF